MNVVLSIPDVLAERLGGAEADLGRQALEALALDAFRTGRLTRYELRLLLGIETRFELDAFLKERGVFEEHTLAEVEEDVRTLERLGF